MDELTLAIREFCYGGGRAIPVSVFLGRVVGPGEPEWLHEDRQAALDWLAYERSLCSGCKRPRDESFALEMDDRYDVTVLQCHACAARDLRAWNRAQSREQGMPPAFGQFYVVQPEAPDTEQVAG